MSVASNPNPPPPQKKEEEENKPRAPQKVSFWVCLRPSFSLSLSLSISPPGAPWRSLRQTSPAALVPTHLAFVSGKPKRYSLKQYDSTKCQYYCIKGQGYPLSSHGKLTAGGSVILLKRTPLIHFRLIRRNMRQVWMYPKNKRRVFSLEASRKYVLLEFLHDRLACCCLLFARPRRSSCGTPKGINWLGTSTLRPPRLASFQTGPNRVSSILQPRLQLCKGPSGLKETPQLKLDNAPATKRKK